MSVSHPLLLGTANPFGTTLFPHCDYDRAVNQEALIPQPINKACLENPLPLDQRSANFFFKISILGFDVRTVSIATT